MRKDKGKLEWRTRNGRKALTTTPHGGKGEMKTKGQGTENGEALR
jgi:hypothetical protein